MRRQHLCLAGLLAALTAFSVATTARADLQLFYPFIDATNPNPNEISNLGATGTPGTFMGGDLTNYVDGAPNSFSSIAIGQVQGGLQFNGVGDSNNATATRILTGLSTTVLGMQSSNYTAAGWIKLDNLTGDSMIFGQAGAEPFLHLGVRDPRAHFGHWAADTGGSQTLNANQWYHLTFVNNNGNQQIWVNGALDNSSNQANLSNPADLLIGSSGNNGTVAGVLDDVMVYNEALSAPQIQHLAAGGDPTALPDPQFSGRFTYIQAANGKWNRVSYYNVPVTYEQAQALAATKSFNLMDGRLASPRNQLDTERLAGLWEANGSSAWVGLDDLAVEGEWRLATGEQIWQGAADGTPVGGAFNNWNPGEPNNAGEEDAAEIIIGHGRWNDLPHANPGFARHFIVEHDTQLDAKPALPGPSGVFGSWGVQVRNGAGNFHSPLGAEAAAYSGLGNAVNAQASVINFNDPQGPNNGRFGNFDTPFPGNTGGDDQFFTMIAKGTIRIPAGEGGDYTIGFRSDDGSFLRVVGQNFISSANCGDVNQLRTSGGHHQDTLAFLAPSGDACMLGVVNLAPGDYQIEYMFNEISGGASAEVFAARGAHAAFNDQFRLVGYQEGRSVAKPGVGTEGWIVVASPARAPNTGPFLNNFAEANAALDSALADGTAIIADGVPSINYIDPQSGAAHSFGGDVNFPGATGGDDDDFAIRAVAQLVVPVDGNYQFGFRGDDGGYVRITGGPGGNGGSFSSVLVNATGLSQIQENGDLLICDCLTGDSNTLSETFLAAGTYDIETGFFERGGGSSFELYANGPGTSLMLLTAGMGGATPDLAGNGLQLVPEPSTTLLAAMGLVGLGVVMLRRRRIG